ncbi:MAG: hypothetical protein ACFFD8_08000 [Candidatus Thorarchaeota archaeon]
MSKAQDISDAVMIRTYCHSCQHDIEVSVPKIIVDEADSYPVSHAHLHGEPTHVIIVYIDNQYHVRGTELSETVTIEKPPKSTPLNAMVLLRIPPRYKQTAMAMLKMRQANSAQISTITGKSLNAESKYLGALFRLGYLERIRCKRFYQYQIPGSTR